MKKYKKETTTIVSIAAIGATLAFVEGIFAWIAIGVIVVFLGYTLFSKDTTSNNDKV